MGGWDNMKLVVLVLGVTALVGLSLTMRRGRQAGVEREREREVWRQEERYRLEAELSKLRAIAEEQDRETRASADELLREVEAARDEVRRERGDELRRLHVSAR